MQALPYMKGKTMEYPQMIYNGNLTEAGKEIVTYMEATIKQAIENAPTKAEALNKLPGHITYYYQNVHALKTETAEKFVENYERSLVKYAWNDMVFLQEQVQQAETVQETAEQTSELAQALESLREELAAVRKELATEKGRVTKLTKRLSEQEEATETEETTEDEPEEETPDVSEDETEEETD